MNLLAPSGVGLADVRRVLSIPVATAQCRAFLQRELPGAVATWPPRPRPRPPAGRGAEHDGHTAAIAPSVAAKVYGLEMLATDIEDHPDNATRFVVVARHGIPPPTGHDKTSVVIFQRTDRPGLAAHDPAGVRGPVDQPDQARVAARPRRASATTASSSTSKATSATSWSPTACAT